MSTIKYVVDCDEPDTITPHGFTTKRDAIREFIELVGGRAYLTYDEVRAIFRDLRKHGVHTLQVDKPERYGGTAYTYTIQTGKKYSHGGMMGYNCGDVLAIDHELLEL